MKAVFALAPRPARRRRRPHRRLGRLVRRRRGLELARRGRPVGGARDLDQLDRPPAGARAAGAREDRRDGRLPRLARPEARRPGGVRAPRRGVRREPRDGRAVRGGALVAPDAEGRQDAGLHDAGPPRLRLRARAGAERLPRARRPEAALDRPPRPRAVVVPRGRHAGDARRGRALVRPLPPRRHRRAAREAGRDLARALAGQPDAVRRACRRSSSRRGGDFATVAAARGVSPRPAATGFRSPPLRAAAEVFGSPIVEVTANATGGWSRIVAVLSARTPAGKEIVVAGGGVPTRAGQADVPDRRSATRRRSSRRARGSRVTIGSSSLAQSPGNLLYLDLPFAPGARLVVTGGTLRLPELATPISR